MSKRGGKGGPGNLAALIVLLLVLCFVLVIYSGRSFDDPLGNVIRPQVTVRSTTSTTLTQSRDTIKIASWNLQRFGMDKAENLSLLDSYVDVLAEYDIIVLQEITDSTGEAFGMLCKRMKGYTCRLSDRLGTSAYKEQYGLIYRNAQLLSEVKGTGVYVRSPYTYRFRSGNWIFQLTTIHTDPDNVKAELALLDAQLSASDGPDHVIMGDLNADCSYYKTPVTDFTSWTWAIPDKEDTTVKATNCVYDRIIFNRQAMNNFIGYGVMRNVSAGQSDHYLVYGEYRTGEA